MVTEAFIKLGKEDHVYVELDVHDEAIQVV